MENRLPYQIPGPAGGFTQSQPLTAPTTPKPTLSVFQTTPWHAMLQHLHNKIPSSIALLRRNALSNDYTKLPMLPVLIDALTPVGKDASARLRDPTGAIGATLHAGVFAARKDAVHVGAVLLLHQVAAIYYLDERRGFRAPTDAVHLSIQAAHVVALFRATPGAPLKNTPLLETYEEQARFPPAVVLAPRRRPPLRERGGAYRGNALRGRAGLTGRGGRGVSREVERRRTMHVGQEGGASVRQHIGRGRAVARVGLKRAFDGTNVCGDIQRRGGMSQVQTTSRETRGVAAMTEDELDSLLGEVDVDALIAASGKAATGGSDDAEKGTAEVGETAEGVDRNGCATEREEQQTDRQQGNLSAVDEAMIDSLFEGLEASDFT